MNNNRNNNNNNSPSPQGDNLVLYIENVINTAILLQNRSQRVNPSRDRSPRLIPSCKLYRGPVPATGPCDRSLRLVPSCVATFTYLSALGYIHRLASLPDPTKLELIKCALKGYAKINPTLASRLPVTLLIF